MITKQKISGLYLKKIFKKLEESIKKVKKVKKVISN